MTARVPRRMGNTPRTARNHIGQPLTGSLGSAYVDFCAHLGGAQGSQCAEVLFGSSEDTNGTWHLLVYCSGNARAVVVCIVPMGYTGSTPSITIAAAEAPIAHAVRQDVAGVTDLGDLASPAPFRWTVPVTAGWNAIDIAVVNTRLHSLVAYEVPRAELRGSEIHLDRSFADPGSFITDANAGSNVRGATELINQPRRLRTIMRRHVLNLPCRPGRSSVGAGPDYLIGSATAADGPRIVARDVGGGTTTTTPVRCKIRVDSLGAGWTGTITCIFPGGSNATIVGVNATGYWPRAGGELVDQGAAGAMAFVDRFKCTAQRLGGAGVVTIDEFVVVEDR